MKKTWLFFLMVVLAFSMTMIGCGGGDDDEGGDPKPFTFLYEGDISLAKNTWEDGKKANNQAILQGTIVNSIESGKTYEVHITGTLSDEAIIQVVLLDNASVWTVLSDYKAEDSETADPDNEGKFLPKNLQAGAIDTTILVTTTAAGGSSAAGNKVVVQALKPSSTDADDDRSVAETVTITGAKVTVAEEGADPPGGDDEEPAITYNVIKAVTSEGNEQGKVTTITYDGIKIMRDYEWKPVARFDLAFTDIKAKLSTWEFASSKYEIEITGTTDTAIAKGTDNTGIQLAIVKNETGAGQYSGFEGIETGAFSFKLWAGDSTIGLDPDTLQIVWKTAEAPVVGDTPVATWTNVTITLKPIAD